MMQSILSRISPAQVVRDPFPHVCIDNALEDGLARRLLQEFPASELLAGGQSLGSNRKFSVSAARALSERPFSDAWMDALKVHVQPSEWLDSLRIFRPHIEREFPALGDRLGDLDNLRVGIKHFDRFPDVDVVIDCKPLIHTPVRGAPSVERGPHLKNFRTLFTWYLYLRAEADRSTGAEHVLYRVKPGADVTLNERQTVDPQALEPVVTIPYRQNAFMMFLNTPRSFQGNVPRSAGDVPLMAMIGSIYLRERLFFVASRPGLEAGDFVPQSPPPQPAGWLRSLLRRRT